MLGAVVQKPGKAPKGVTTSLWKLLLNKAQPGTFVTIHQLWLVSHERAGEKKKTALLDARFTLQAPSKFEVNSELLGDAE